jgi:hypothetical protein
MVLASYERMVQSASRSSPWPRRWCALLFWSGCVVAAVLIVLHGVRGMLVGYALWVLAWAAAARADPSKWPR